MNSSQYLFIMLLNLSSEEVSLNRPMLLISDGEKSINNSSPCPEPNSKLQHLICFNCKTINIDDMYINTCQ